MAIASAPAEALLAWAAAHPAYTYNVEATELGPSGASAQTTLRIGFDGHTETVHVVKGEGAGTDITWRGGPTVTVRPRGLLHVVSLNMGLRDRRVLSPRKNDIRTGVLSNVAACFVRYADSIKVERANTTQRVFAIQNERGIHCGEADGDTRITVDRLTIASDGQPVARERYIGSQLVVRWAISDFTSAP